MAKFELVFVGGTRQRYRRWHPSYDAAEQAAQRVLAKMDDGDPAGEQRAAHPAIIYGPDCGQDGKTIA
jgi:hypothetical protein